MCVTGVPSMVSEKAAGLMCAEGCKGGEVAACAAGACSSGDGTSVAGGREGRMEEAVAFTGGEGAVASKCVWGGTSWKNGCRGGCRKQKGGVVYRVAGVRRVSGSGQSRKRDGRRHIDRANGSAGVQSFGCGWK